MQSYVLYITNLPIRRTQKSEICPYEEKSFSDLDFSEPNYEFIRIITIRAKSFSPSLVIWFGSFTLFSLSVLLMDQTIG